MLPKYIKFHKLPNRIVTNYRIRGKDMLNNDTRMPNPSFKMVLTAVGNYALKRKDGIYVVPIGCLKP